MLRSRELVDAGAQSDRPRGIGDRVSVESVIDFCGICSKNSQSRCVSGRHGWRGQAINEFSATATIGLEGCGNAARETAVLGFTLIPR